MNKFTKYLKSLAIVLLGLAMLMEVGFSAFRPGRTECIAPAGAGGGWDFTCRIPAAKVMRELKLFRGSMKVVNMAGAGGGIAYAHVVGKQEGNENLIVAGSQATAVRLAQNAYSGFKHDDVKWLGAIGADYGVIAVSKNSKYKNLADFLQAMKKNPAFIRISGGSAAGGWDHLKVLLLAKKAGVKDLRKVNYVSFNSGGEAIIELIGNRVDAFTGDTSEVVGQFDAGQVRILAVLAPERVNRLGSSPTAEEQGYDVIGANWRGFYAPPGISDDAYDYWADAVKQVAKSSQWADLRDKNGLAPFEAFGQDFEDFLNEQIEEVKEISLQLGLIKN